MTTEAPSAGPTARPPLARDRILGLRCRNCGDRQPIGPAYVCPTCFGPLEVAYDLEAVRSLVARDDLAARPAGIWRYLELLPVEAPPARGLAVGGTPLVDAARLAAALGLERLWVKDDTRNPTLSFKDRAVAIAAARAQGFGLAALGCASTGNLAGATAAAAAAIGLPAYVFVPADLEPAKIDHALAYGATVIPLDGTYDDVNRLCLEVADELPWGIVNVNLRPFYAEGSKTLAFEIAEALGWRLPDVVVAPVASGAMLIKVARAFEELVELGWVPAKAVRFVGGQAAGCAPVARAFAEGTSDIRPIRTPDTIVRSLAIGNPADGRYAVELARASGGSIEAVPDDATADGIRLAARLEGIYTETAGGVTISAARAAAAGGVIRPGDEVVALLTGNGLKTPDAIGFGVATEPAKPGRPGLAPVLTASFGAFERWLAA
jgi:threonine synthase